MRGKKVNKKFKVEEIDETKRVDNFLASCFDDLSRSNIQKSIKEGKVTVNEKIIKSNFRLKADDIININLEPPKKVDILPEDMDLNIVYEDRELLVLNKKEGVVVHPAPGHYTGTLVNGLMHHCKGELSGINGELRPGIIHRIDKDTTGILVIAKTNEAHIKLSKQLEEHTMTRKYHAIVHNVIKNDTGKVDKPIARSKKDRKKMTIDLNGKRAVTHYKVLERLDNFTYAEFSLETGRTHQIRVHMKYLGHPLLGDESYSSNKHKFNLKGQVLHAKTLGFIHPKTNKYVEFTTELPKDFIKVLNYYRKIKR